MTLLSLSSVSETCLFSLHCVRNPKPMNRRSLLLGLAALSAGSLPLTSAAQAPELLAFEEMYADVSALGLRFSEKLERLAGSAVRMQGFMAPPLKAEAKFFVLTQSPVSLCPFCSTDADWPDSIVVVFLEKAQDFVQANRLIEVTGILEVGSALDEETGFVSLVRITNARFRTV